MVPIEVNAYGYKVGTHALERSVFEIKKFLQAMKRYVF